MAETNPDDRPVIAEWHAVRPKAAEYFGVWGVFTVIGLAAGATRFFSDPRPGQQPSSLAEDACFAGAISLAGGLMTLLIACVAVRHIRLTDRALEIHRRLFSRVIPRPRIAGVFLPAGQRLLRQPGRWSIRVLLRDSRTPTFVGLESEFDAEPGMIAQTLAQTLGVVRSPPQFEERFTDYLAEAERFREGDEYVWRAPPRQFGHVLTALSVLVLLGVGAFWGSFWTWYVEVIVALGEWTVGVPAVVLGLAITHLAGNLLELLFGRPLEFRASKAGVAMRRTFGRRDIVPVERILGVEWTIDQPRAGQGAYIAIDRPGRRPHLWRVAARFVGARPEPLLAALVALYGRLIDPPYGTDLRTGAG